MNLKKGYFTSILLLSCSLYAVAQNKQQACTNDDLHAQADSLKRKLLEAGFSMVQESRVTMESHYELPVIVAMKEGVHYQLIFISDYRSTLSEVRVLDFNEKEVAFQRSDMELTGNRIISHAFEPRMSEYHMIRPMQANMNKEPLCGYFMIMKKTP